MQREAGKVMTWKNLMPRGGETTSKSTMHEYVEQRLQKTSKTEEQLPSNKLSSKVAGKAVNPTPFKKTPKASEEKEQVAKLLSNKRCNTTGNFSII